MTDKCWTVGFAGTGDVTHDNAWGLLDHLLPEDAEVQALVPARIGRGLTGLRMVTKLLEHEFDIPQIEYTDEQLITKLTKADAEGETAMLIVLGLDDATTVLATAALEAGVVVKDLCAALDDVEFEPEPGAPVQAEVVGPATIATPQDKVAAQLLEQAIRTIIREELQMFPGVHASAEIRGATKEPAAEEGPKVRAYVTPEGAYRLAGKRTRKKVIEDEVELTEAEARELSLIE
jgi:hypothetical protein